MSIITNDILLPWFLLDIDVEDFEGESLTFPSIMHAFEAYKNPTDIEYVNSIIEAKTKNAVISISDSLDNFDQEDWNSRQSDILRNLYLIRLGDDDFREALISAKNEDALTYESDDPFLESAVNNILIELADSIVELDPDTDEEGLDPKSDYDYEEDDEEEEEQEEDEQEDEEEEEIEIDSNPELLFVIGKSMQNKYPGKGPNEIIPKDLPKDYFDDLRRIQHWRKMMDDSFEKLYDSDYDFSFNLNGKRWRTVKHYLYSMMFSLDPEHAFMFSMDAQEEYPNSGYWSDIRSADMEYKKKIDDVDPGYNDNEEFYLLEAHKAKFSQHQILKDALLNTKNATIGILDEDSVILANTLMIVRDWIRKNPYKIYYSDSHIEEVLPEFLPIKDAVELNGKSKYSKPIDSYTSFSIEPIMLNTGCIVYIATGVRKIDMDTIIESYGEPNVIQRCVYGMVLLAHDKKSQIGVFYQTTSTNVKIKYKYFDIEQDSIRMRVLMESHINGYSVMLISETQSELALNMLKIIAG